LGTEAKAAAREVPRIPYLQSPNIRCAFDDSSSPSSVVYFLIPVLVAFFLMRNPTT